MSGHRPGHCSSGKTLLHSRRLARDVIRRMVARERRLHPYRCPECGWWHVGGRPPAEKLAEWRERDREEAR